MDLLVDFLSLLFLSLEHFNFIVLSLELGVNVWFSWLGASQAFLFVLIVEHLEFREFFTPVLIIFTEFVNFSLIFTD